ncbi:MAG: hypothetical protein AAF547_06025 [Actinomycetota bacterium]
MKFLCGRPGCGLESTATLQIDAPSTTVSLVDPRISRDGVPLCARHADATTPPMGWTMNDLRSRNRSLAAVPDEVPTSTPPRVRPAADDAAGRRMSRRQSIAERARRLEAETDVQADAEVEIDRSVDTDQQLTLDGTGSEADHRWSSSRPTAEEPEVVASADAEAHVDADLDGEVDEGPSSRPDRRRQPQDDEAPDEDKFPWHFQFDDDEPEELQASSPLLSRAFRATIG